MAKPPISLTGASLRPAGPHFPSADSHSCSADRKLQVAVLPQDVTKHNLFHHLLVCNTNRGLANKMNLGLLECRGV